MLYLHNQTKTRWLAPSWCSFSSDMNDLKSATNNIAHPIKILSDFQQAFDETPTKDPWGTYMEYSFEQNKRYFICLLWDNYYITDGYTGKTQVTIRATTGTKASSAVDIIYQNKKNDNFQCYVYTPTGDSNYLNLSLRVDITKNLKFSVFIVDIDSININDINANLLTLETTVSDNLLKTLHGNNTLISNQSALVAPYNDLNTIPANEIIAYVSVIPDHAPGTEYDAITVFTLSRRIDGKINNFSPQIAVCYKADKQNIFYRIPTGPISSLVWTDWTPLAVENNDPVIDLSMFEHVAVIGDSFASGATAYNDYTLNYPISWVQIMARKYGFDAVNYSFGGLTTRTWLTNSNGLQKLQSDTYKQLYFVALGINDSNPDYRNVPVGTIADFTDQSEPDTFYGNMGRIYRAIIAKNSAAIICYITIPRVGDRYTPYNTAINAIAQSVGAMVINSTDSQLFTSEWWLGELRDSHPTAPMYSAMANVYAELFKKACLNGMNYIREYNGYENGVAPN